MEVDLAGFDSVLAVDAGFAVEGALAAGSGPGEQLYCPTSRAWRVELRVR